ncbi:MAG TPA: 2Fe-2S iron-sulfur cluster-binding protein [Burkholderiaceae bacterium]|nr:2Fe-2S iron-sulfur cluster-binding protein [Burkholderiaceae bacterium]
MPETIVLFIDGHPVTVTAGSTVAAAIALATGGASATTRRSVGGALRGPLCGMGVCQECRVEIDGHAHRLACQTLCAADMQVITGAVSA